VTQPGSVALAHLHQWPMHTAVMSERKHDWTPLHQEGRPQRGQERHETSGQLGPARCTEFGSVIARLGVVLGGWVWY
jgi:hypothetical protein